MLSPLTVSPFQPYKRKQYDFGTESGTMNKKFRTSDPSGSPNRLLSSWLTTPSYNPYQLPNALTGQIFYPRMQLAPNYLSPIRSKFPLGQPLVATSFGPLFTFDPSASMMQTLLPDQSKPMPEAELLSKKIKKVRKTKCNKKRSPRSNSPKDYEDHRGIPLEACFPISPDGSDYSGGSGSSDFNFNETEFSDGTSEFKQQPQLKHIPILNGLIKERLQSAGTISRVSECRLCGSFSCGADNVRTITTFMRSHLYTHVPTVFTCAICKTYKANTMSRMRHHIRKFHDEKLLGKASSIIDSRYDIDDKLSDLAIRCFSSSVIQAVPESAK